MLKKCCVWLKLGLRCISLSRGRVDIMGNHTKGGKLIFVWIVFFPSFSDICVLSIPHGK